MRSSAELGIDEIPSPALLVSRDGSILSANPHSERLFGYGRGELADLELDQLVHTDHREACRRLLETALADQTAGSPSQLRQIKGITKDGREIAIEIDVGPTADGSVVAVVIRDVTEAARTLARLELEREVRELQASEERYELAVAGSDTGLFDWDIRSNELYTSDRLKELLGYAPGEISITMDWFWEQLHPDDSAAVRPALEKHLEDRVLYDIEYRLRTKSEGYRWFHARGQALWDETGQAIRMLGSLADIDQRKQAEEELTRSEERFRNLMEQSPLGIVILTPDGRITQVNSAWMQAWGIDELETGRVMSEYSFLTDPQIEELGLMPLVEKGFAGERVVLPPIEYSGTRAMADLGLEDIEPRTVWIQVHLYSVKDEQGAVAYVVGINLDITELKRAERQAREQREVLARLDRATSMGKLTGSIAHELNQPLTGILSTAQAGEIMLKSPNARYEPAELAEILTAIVADAKRAGKVIHNLRELYREQKGEFEPVDINAIVDGTEQLLHSEFVVREVAVAKELNATAASVFGNSVQIQQVLVNLITNGIQAMSDVARKDCRLRIATASDANDIRLWVEDCGPGIDADKLDRIFEPLATWKPGGTGMGLAISNSIIEGHGGRMWAENKPEGGARVGFVLPLLKEGDHT